MVGVPAGGAPEPERLVGGDELARHGAERPDTDHEPPRRPGRQVRSEETTRAAPPRVAPLEVVCFTDPLCCWSWAFEPTARLTRHQLGDGLRWRDVMAGMIADWSTYDDPLNAIHRPAQMAPLWYAVARRTGMPLDERLWSEDPPASSYPACLAVKAAGLQGPAAAEAMLRRLREAAMLERRNVARRAVLQEIAGELAGDRPDLLDADRFAGDLGGERALQALRDDVEEARRRGIGRFPSFIARRPGGRAVMAVGYRPAAAFRAVLDALDLDLPAAAPQHDAVAYALHWESITSTEVAAACGCDVAEIQAQLDVAAARGHLSRAGAVYRRKPDRGMEVAPSGRARGRDPEVR